MEKDVIDAIQENEEEINKLKSQNAFKQSQLFIKKYHNTAICLCKKCAVKLCTEIDNYKIARSLENLKGSIKK